MPQTIAMRQVAAPRSPAVLSKAGVLGARHNVACTPKTLCARPAFGSRTARSLSLQVDALRSGVKYVASEPKDGKMNLEVTVSGAVTQASYDKLLEDARKNQGQNKQLPGWKKDKQGNMVIPEKLLVQMLGKKAVYTFIVEDLVNNTVREYVEENDLNTDKQSSIDLSKDEFVNKFKPGGQMQFNAELTLIDPTNAEPILELSDEAIRTMKAADGE